jgi:hypothetical protein
VSERSRPQRRRAARGAADRAQTKRPAAPRRPAAPKTAARFGSAGFLNYLIIALLVVLAAMIVTILLFVFRYGP